LNIGLGLNIGLALNIGLRLNKTRQSHDNHKIITKQDKTRQDNHTIITR
jgi:hypothetical protein